MQSLLSQPDNDWLKTLHLKRQMIVHVYQLDVFVKHGFELWTNYWYAGRYTFVGYSLIYYPLAALVGIKLLAVLSAALATAAFTLILRGTWGEQTTWSTRLISTC